MNKSSFHPAVCISQCLMAPKWLVLALMLAALAAAQAVAAARPQCTHSDLVFANGHKVFGIFLGTTERGNLFAPRRDIGKKLSLDSSPIQWRCLKAEVFGNNGKFSILRDDIKLEITLILHFAVPEGDVIRKNHIFRRC